MGKYLYQKEEFSDQILEAEGSRTVQSYYMSTSKSSYFAEYSIENMRQLLAQ